MKRPDEQKLTCVQQSQTTWPYRLSRIDQPPPEPKLFLGFSWDPPSKVSDAFLEKCTILFRTSYPAPGSLSSKFPNFGLQNLRNKAFLSYFLFVALQVCAGDQCVLEVHNLKANTQYMFAVAAYTQAHELIGASIGEATQPIITAYNLPLLPIVGTLCKVNSRRNVSLLDLTSPVYRESFFTRWFAFTNSETLLTR